MTSAIHQTETPPLNSSSNNRPNFLSLPQELKNQIYSHICSSHLIHIENELAISGPPNGPNSVDILYIRNHICIRKDIHTCTGDIMHLHDPAGGDHLRYQHAECLAKALAVEKTKFTGNWDTCRFGTICCTNRVSEVHEHADAMLGLRFLRTCREIHEAASSLPYTTNTFSFSDDHALSSFMRTYLHTSQIRHVKLRIDLSDIMACWNLWQYSIRELALRCKELRSLEVAISDTSLPLSVNGKLPFLSWKGQGHEAKAGLALLAMLELAEILDGIRFSDLLEHKPLLDGPWGVVNGYEARFSEAKL